MEEKKGSDNQKLISKIKYIRSLSPSNNDNQNRKRESKETPEESENKYESSLTKNKSKKKTTYKTKKKQREYENNYQAVDSNKNMEDSFDKKNKLYENQRDNFLNKYMLKARENGFEETPNYENKTAEAKVSPDLSHINNNEKLLDLIEIIKNKNKKYEK